MSTAATTTRTSRLHGRRHLWLLGIAVLVLAGAGVAWAAMHQPSRMFHHSGPGMMKLHAEFIVDRALRNVDATDEQRHEVEAIVERFFTEHEGFRAERKAMHDEMAVVLTAEKIDRTQIEALRARHLALADKASRQIAQALADAADVLTPEQRQRLVEWLKSVHD